MIENRLVKQQVSLALDKAELINKINPMWLINALHFWEDEYGCTHNSDEVSEWYCTLDYSNCYKPEYQPEYDVIPEDLLTERVFIPVSGLLMDIIGVDE